MTTQQTNFRLDSQIKDQAYAVLARIGLKPTEAVNMFMAYIAMFESLPFRPRIPNKETIDAMKEDRKNLKSYENLEELFKELEI